MSDIETENKAGKSSWKRLIAPAAIATLLFVAWALGWFEYFTLSSLIAREAHLSFMVDNHLIVSAILFFVIYLAAVAVSFPGASLFTLLGGLAFGGIGGGIISVLGATMGAVIIFLIARSSFSDILENKAGSFVKRMSKGFQEDSFHYLLFLRLTPIFPFWVVNIVPGLLNMKLSPYFFATLVGIIPGTFAYAFVGAGLASILEAQEKVNPGCARAGSCSIDLNALVTPEIVFAMVALGVVSILPVLTKRLKNKYR